jgi:hypothetical protein
MKIKREPLVFALIYTVLSVAAEIGLARYLNLTMYKDSALIWAIILTVPTVLAAWICGYRGVKEFALVAGLTALLTFVITQLLMRSIPFSTGLVEPIVERSLAALLAAEITKRVAAKASQTAPSA